MADAARVAILGGTGHVGRALASELAECCRLTLYARRPDVARSFAAKVRSAYSLQVRDFDDLASHEHDALVNCIGIGDPAGVRDPVIFDEVTRYGDDLALGYLGRNPDTVLVNMSSGAAYCSDFEQAVTGGDLVEIVPCGVGDAYGRAKRSSEVRHRAQRDSAIIDLRLFGFFSRHIDLDTTYLMADIVRSLRSGKPLVTGPSDLVRDYVAPHDLGALVMACMNADRHSTAYDVYSARPVRKSEILEAFVEQFGLTYSVEETGTLLGTQPKPAYYSVDRRAGAVGYEPTRTSLETLTEETAALLKTIG